ncbi:MAG TPA: F0F1 ATP synthase subunit B [Mycobacteriales bacterium]|jgi:F-type H+-transporting ATPase subunit b
MHTEAASIFLIPNATFIAELVAFLVILAVLWRWVVPPIQKAMRERQELIRTQLEESREAKEKLESARSEYEESLHEARAKAAEIRENARAEAQAIVEEMRTQAQTEADRIRVRGEEQLAAQRRQVIAELRTEIGQMSVQLASRIVGESLDDDARRHGTVDRFIGELDELSAGGDSPDVTVPR